jgi:hypothetical protein
MRRGMGLDFSWRRSADEYDRIYAEARDKVLRDGPPTLQTVRAAVEVR